MAKKSLVVKQPRRAHSADRTLNHGVGIRRVHQNYSIFFLGMRRAEVAPHRHLVDTSAIREACVLQILGDDPADVPALLDEIGPRRPAR